MFRLLCGKRNLLRRCLLFYLCGIKHRVQYTGTRYEWRIVAIAGIPLLCPFLVLEFAKFSLFRLDRLLPMGNWPQLRLVASWKCLFMYGLTKASWHCSFCSSVSNSNVKKGGVGKFFGITSFAWLAVRLGLAKLPVGVEWRHILGASWLGGIGFTMPLFIGQLAFADKPSLFEEARFGIIMASVISAVIGLAWLYLSARKPRINR